MSKKPNDSLPVARGYTRDAGYVRVWRELYTCYGRRLGLDGLALWAFLRDHVNRANGLAWPGYRLMQAAFYMGRRDTLSRLIARLEAAGLIEPFPAAKAIPDLYTRRELGINDRGVVYLVHDPPAAIEFALLTGGRYCADCPFQRCPVKNPGSKNKGGASAGGGCKTQPPVVAKRDHNKTELTNSVVVEEHDEKEDSLMARMIALKVSKKTREAFAKKFEPDYLAQKLDMTERKLADGGIRGSPAGFFVCACEEDWLPPPEIERKAKTANKKSSAQTILEGMKHDH